MAQTCVHCGRACRTTAGGYSSSKEGLPLCHPNESGRPDCYHMVEVYHHDVVDCERCAQNPYTPPTQLEMHEALLEALQNLDRMVRDILP